MSTRSCIARLVSKEGKSIQFSGVYHHWDGYPSGLGRTLFELRNGHFNGDTEAMLKLLIDTHPQGWSTINGANFELPASPREDDNLQECAVCHLPAWRHYAKYYTKGNTYWEKAGRPKCPPKVSGYLVTDHIPQSIKKPHGPECFVDGDGASVTEKNASDCGCEYTYAFLPDGKSMLILSSYCENGAKMIGMLGCGDPDAKWKPIGQVWFDSVAPKDWDKIPLRNRKPASRKSIKALYRTRVKI